jgi:hypothetical protein
MMNKLLSDISVIESNPFAVASLTVDDEEWRESDQEQSLQSSRLQSLGTTQFE